MIMSMDWYSWLSKTNLEPSLAYEYGLAFTRNELEKEDLVYLNHEFLQSLGVTVAKHRLEILKLATKEVGGRSRGNPNGLSRLVLAFNKTKKLFTKWSFQKNSTHVHVPLSDLSCYGTQWSGALRRFSSAKESKQLEKSVISSSKNITRSGPLDRKVQDKMMMTNTKCLSISGPLDGKLIQEKWMPVNWSPIRTGPTDGKWRERSAFGSRSPSIYGAWKGRSLRSPMLNHYYRGSGNAAGDDGGHSLWSLMFQDMKPT